MDKIIVAHGGASAYCRKNTIDSFKKALDLKVDMIEFDIRRTKDGFFVVFHDDNIKNIKLKDISYTDLEKNTNFHIPKLQEIFSLLKGKTKIDIHLKERGYETKVAKMALEYFKTEDILISSMFPSSLKSVKSYDKRIKTGFILDKKDILNFHMYIPLGFFPKERIKKSQTDFIIPYWRFADPIFLEKARKYDIPVLVWTLNKPELIKKFLSNEGVYGIISDRPDLVINLRKS